MEGIEKTIQDDIHNLLIKIMNNKNNPTQKTRFNIKCEFEDENNKNNSIKVECEFNLLKFNDILLNKKGDFK